MSKYRVSPETIRELLDYDESTGRLSWKRRSREMFKSERDQKIWNSRFAGRVVGSRHTHGYLTVCIQYEQHFVHRVVFAHVHGRWPEGEIDHINRQKADNRIENLREVGRAENLHNRSLRSPNNKTSGLLGVHQGRRAGTWIAHIQENGTKHHLGVFETAKEAQSAYLDAKRRFHAGYVESGGSAHEAD